jgi:3-oxoacyl-ACP reductase-like protein
VIPAEAPAEISRLRWPDAGVVRSTAAVSEGARVEPVEEIWLDAGVRTATFAGMSRFADRVAIVTGAGAAVGIGIAIARQLVSDGARVVVGATSHRVFE